MRRRINKDSIADKGGSGVKGTGELSFDILIIDRSLFFLSSRENEAKPLDKTQNGLLEREAALGALKKLSDFISEDEYSTVRLMMEKAP